jgi:hypothetical protein
VTAKTATSPRRLPRWAGSVAVGLAGVVAGAAAVSPGRGPERGGQSSGAAPVVRADVADDAGPRAVEAGVPVGYARTGPGAAAAATAYLTVAAEQVLLMDGPAREAALARMLVPGASAQTRALVGGSTALLDRVRKAASASGTPRAVLRNLPVAYRVDAFSEARARVSVWAAAVWSIAGVGGPGEAWTTTVVELEWVDDDWRLWSLSSREGPTPATTSGPVAGTDELIGALAGFSSYRYDPS